VYCFPDPSVHSVAFSVDHLGAVPVYDVVERNSVVCDCRLVLLSCGGLTIKSMNRDEGSYQLPHIYDYLLSATATSGRQSFQRTQQRLPKRQQLANQKDCFLTNLRNLLS